MTDQGDATPAEGIVRNAGFALASQLITAAFTAALTIFLARVLGPGTFGVFSLAIALAAVLVLPGDAGISGSAARFIAERRDNAAAVRRVLRQASWLRLFTSGGITAVLLLSADVIADAYDEPDLAWTLRGMALAIFGQNLMQLYGSGFTALGRISLSFRSNLLKSVVETAATIGLVLGGAGVVGAAAGRAAGFLAGGALAVLLMRRLLSRSPSRDNGSDQPVGRRRLAGYAGALLVIDGALVLFEQIDVLLIGAIISVTAAGLFQAPLRLITFLHYPSYALASAVSPRLAGGAAAGHEAFGRALRLVIVFQGVLIAPLAVWADPIVKLVLGSEYDGSVEVLRALTPFVFLAGVGPLVTMAVDYLGEARRRIPIAVATIALNALIDVILLPVMGIVAAAIATNVAYGIYVPAHLYLCRRLIGFEVGPLAVTFLKVLIAAALMCLPLFALGTSDVAPALLPLGAMSSLALYLAALIGLRELSVAELRDLVATASSRLLPSRS